MKRSEIIFLYDASWVNPNGDPNDDNKPRIDEETGLNIVTDVRLKRTIRDYLHDFKRMEIFIREIETVEGKIQDAKQRANDFFKLENDRKSADYTFDQYQTNIQNNILSECVDVRLFGCTIPLEKGKDKGSITFTGPAQFQMGTSLHKVKLEHIKGSGAFASGANSSQKTFREEYVLPYSLIMFHGLINENAAKHTKMTEVDAELLMEAIWNGTKNLISRSKVGQMPRLSLRVIYKESLFHIGDLHRRLELQSDLTDEQLRTTKDYTLLINSLMSTLEVNKDKIEKIQVTLDNELKLNEDIKVAIDKIGIKLEELIY